jgi:hypothetical protein
MEQLMHRMILARPDLADLHPRSRAYLAGEAASRPGMGRPRAARSARRREPGRRPHRGRPRDG